MVSNKQLLSKGPFYIMCTCFSIHSLQPSLVVLFCSALASEVLRGVNDSPDWQPTPEYGKANMGSTSGCSAPPACSPVLSGCLTSFAAKS